MAHIFKKEFAKTARRPQLKPSNGTSFYTVAEAPLENNRRTFVIVSSAYNGEHTLEDVKSALEAKRPFGDKTEVNLAWAEALKIPGIEEDEDHLLAAVIDAAKASNHPIDPNELISFKLMF